MQLPYPEQACPSSQVPGGPVASGGHSHTSLSFFPCSLDRHSGNKWEGECRQPAVHQEQTGAFHLYRCLAVRCGHGTTFLLMECEWGHQHVGLEPASHVVHTLSPLGWLEPSLGGNSATGTQTMGMGEQHKGKTLSFCVPVCS